MKSLILKFAVLPTEKEVSVLIIGDVVVVTVVEVPAEMTPLNRVVPTETVP